MTRLEILKNARELISEPGKWLQGRLERKFAAGPSQYCAIGAIEAVLGHDNASNIANAEATEIVEGCLAPAIGKRHRTSVASYNDSHSHECVIAMFDAAITSEEARA